jgi:myosin heavy subunit
VENIKEFNSGSGKKTGYIIIIVILTLMLIGLGYLYLNQKKATEVKIVELTQVSHEKETVTFQYQNLLDDYNSLETSNDSIAKQLNTEKERVKKLMENLRTTKADNKEQIEKYKKELKTLRDIMKGFIHQIDSLNTANIQLTEENTQIKQQISTAKKEHKKLNEKYQEAANKVAIASVIKAINVGMQALNSRGKETTRAKKTKRFSVGFELDENAIALKGTKNVYLRITDPNEHILIQNNQPVFSYEGEEIAYSAVRQIEYDGNTTKAIIYFENSEEGKLTEGNYRVDIFCDGSMIGTVTTSLK